MKLIEPKKLRPMPPCTSGFMLWTTLKKHTICFFNLEYIEPKELCPSSPFTPGFMLVNNLKTSNFPLTLVVMFLKNILRANR